MSFTRYKITHEYDGTAFHGWQRQGDLPTVQKALEDAIRIFLPEASGWAVGGRTDAGVHACGQVAHVDVPPEQAMDPFRLRQALNAHLVSHPVSVLDVQVAPSGFHARFSACQRVYRYRILNRRSPPVLDRHRVWWVIAPLDITRMQEACTVFEGTMDFTTFRSSECQARSPVRTVDQAIILPAGPSLLDICIRARSFLHHQVRNMAGALKYAGEGRWSADDLQKALDARDRKQGAVMAPPFGLYLDAVLYPPGL